eukprot:jgi/Chlat1/8655/Chrsp87S00665
MAAAAAEGRIEAAETALLLIEFQNEFCKEGGAMHDAVKDCMAHTNMLANAAEAARAARASGVSVLHAPIGFEDDYRELSPNPYGILAGAIGANAFKKSGWGYKFVDEVSPSANDTIVSGKVGLDCFFSTNLDFLLRARSIKTLAIAGFLTNCCVESTMRSAYERGYRVVTIHDAAAATSVEAHEAAVQHTFPMFSVPVTTKEFVRQLLD